ncbi:aminotransferase class V-fold PLP-dependent enzyme [Pseudoalteromonas sp. MMG010]|uniref:aminotransferase class V-fold PLP-dependent enzyme n=1 Tax=Pseudoalteromonas sp. MMG010 TaxID=2822685 RepID=UPI001B3A00B2|nr:aminotransferase class V-fold PLP-dependent enzyme [Pseudoalteromonas sp. MMG010]MBQ4833297.1 aminotransferase class V-fold PLP-dependent enzyme [Pseudoalteromonas sp. MMG010]
MSDFLLQGSQNNQVYLDANATTPVLPCIADVVSHTMQICFGNPSSPHITGIQAKHLLEQTRQKACTVIGADTGDILFTSGATEGIQTAIVSTLLSVKNHQLTEPVLMYGATEHKAVPNTLAHWNKVLGINATLLPIPVNNKGILDLAFIERHVKNALMICTMAVNNETGVIQDLNAIETAIRTHNSDVSWMVDCVQALGKSALALSNTSIDYAPFSGHKLYAPKGIGLLYIRQGSAYTPFITGGGQEGGMRAGTENLPGIAGLNKLFSLLLDKSNGTFKSPDILADYRKQLHLAISDTFGDITYNHDFDCSVATTLNFTVNDLTSKEVIDLFDAAGIRVSGGSACSTGATRSYVLDAMGVSNWQSENAIRLSFGPAATAQEIAQACASIRALKPILQANCLVVSDSATPHQEVCAIGLTQYRHQGACSWLYVSEDKHAVIIDPIIELLPRFEKIINTQNLILMAILDTHKHQERASGCQLFSDLFGLTDNQEQDDKLGWPDAMSKIQIGSKTLIKHATPGHSEDSVSYLLQTADGKIEYCFCGDLILPAGLGNTLLLGGDAYAMADSLITLDKVINNDTLICSGHDYQQCFAMTWQVQKQQTPLLEKLLTGGITRDQFSLEKHAFDQQKQQLSTELCGYIEGQPDKNTQQIDVDLAIEMLQQANTYLIDTRESYEHGATDITQLFAINADKIFNIPLSRMANALTQRTLHKGNRYIVLCRSGNRSVQAAVNLAHLGYENVYNITGGLALCH